MTIGNSLRTDMVNRTMVPGPGNYLIKGELERNGVDNPRFHMGIKNDLSEVQKSNFPGPGEYETDIKPNHHSNIAHYIGTGIRSDLGVGKAYLYPGPGDYEYNKDEKLRVQPRIAGTFGSTLKENTIKKTWEPGPG